MAVLMALIEDGKWSWKNEEPLEGSDICGASAIGEQAPRYHSLPSCHPDGFIHSSMTKIVSPKIIKNIGGSGFGSK